MKKVLKIAERNQFRQKSKLAPGILEDIEWDRVAAIAGQGSGDGRVLVGPVGPEQEDLIGCE